MGLIMATPAKRKRSSKYQFRRGTPADLLRAKDKLAVFGIHVPREAVESLNTRDPADAKRLHSEASLRWEAKWEAWRTFLRDGPRVLSQKEIVTLSAEFARQAWAGGGADNPGSPSAWANTAEGFGLIAANGAGRYPTVDAFITVLLHRLLERHGLTAVAPSSFEALKVQFTADLPLIAQGIGAMARGDYREPDWLIGRPRGGEALRPGGKGSPDIAAQPAGHAVTFAKLLESWQRGRGPSPSSIRAYKSRLKDFTKMLGHGNASRVTRDDVHRWLDEMLEAGKVGDETIRDRLATLSSLLEWGVEKRLLAENVAAHVKLRKRLDKVKHKPTRDFTEEEARRILVEGRRKAGFLRWAPWIMAYTAMRVGEVAQLRRKDVMEDGEGGLMLIVDPAAGHVKGHRRREIPAHSALMAEGFMDFVKACKADRLFPQFYRNTERAKDPFKISNDASLLMSRWVRGKDGLGLTDLTIRPSHSWRHLFNTLSREHELERDVRKAMVGHMDDATAESYGSATAKAKRKQIEKLPSPKRN